MKRLLMSVLALGILVSPTSATAQQIDSDINTIPLFTLQVIAAEPTPTIHLPNEIKPKPPVEIPKPVPVVYTVAEGDNLTKIGTAQNVEWQRLWAKNTQLTNPDLIHVGDQITVPFPDEVLARDIPTTVSLPKSTPGVVPLGTYTNNNTYDYGYCTWYVKNRRGASIPNSLGNANTWYSRAADMGMAVGSEPRAGAVGTTTRGDLGHVVYVESVNADGSINISEMNAPVFGGVTYRSTTASEFLYIY